MCLKGKVCIALSGMLGQQKNGRDGRPFHHDTSFRLCFSNHCKGVPDGHVLRLLLHTATRYIPPRCVYSRDSCIFKHPSSGFLFPWGHRVVSYGLPLLVCLLLSGMLRFAWTIDGGSGVVGGGRWAVGSCGAARDEGGRPGLVLFCPPLCIKSLSL